MLIEQANVNDAIEAGLDAYSRMRKKRKLYIYRKYESGWDLRVEEKGRLSYIPAVVVTGSQRHTSRFVHILNIYADGAVSPPLTGYGLRWWDDG